MTESRIVVGAAMSMSLDCFIAGADDSPEVPLGKGGERLFEWYFNGDTASRPGDFSNRRQERNAPRSPRGVAERS